jgi:hypothetical protein
MSIRLDALLLMLRPQCRRSPLVTISLTTGSTTGPPASGRPTRRIDECVTVYERGRLIVRTPPPDVIFAMKLYRGSPQDHEDLISLWPRCAFADPAAATAAFHAAFPHAPEDDHLASYIGEIATAAATEQISDDPPTNSA